MKKSAIVTGGAAGIGRAIASQLARECWNVAVMDITEPKDALDNGVLFLHADV